ncbi:hypothetical protein SLU01_00950 [Sporosarcina luteola]|uniref:Uncharacterized protein n=1 Tax=Sporosarcina luteola TaxID=582850 RepID=A0A511Z2V6_9BACL|nr:hypothetical protein SLU01_00950 [Sporosarcina luteola]
MPVRDGRADEQEPIIYGLLQRFFCVFTARPTKPGVSTDAGGWLVAYLAEHSPFQVVR